MVTGWGPKKILMLGWELPPHNSGGLGVACYNMCQSLAKCHNLEIEFVVPYKLSEQPEFMTVHSVTDLPAPDVQHGAYNSQSPEVHAQQTAYVAFVEKLVSRNDYDAVHAHDWLTFRAGLRAKALTGKPLIAHVHATEFDRAGAHRGNQLVHEVEQQALLLADAIVAVSTFTKDIIMREYGIPASKIQVVHNAINPADYAAVSLQNDYRYLEEMKAMGYKVVVSLGRLSLQKGIPHLLRAAKLALQKQPKLLFLIVGDGEMRSEVIETAANLGITKNVIFTGFLRGKQWRDSYTIADMFVMPSVSEPFGLSALEAAGAGTAVLLSKQSGVSEVLRHTMQFDFWDITKLASQIVAIANYPVLHAELAQNVQNEARDLTWDNTVAKFQNLYAGVNA
ncbi:MAG TPA: glycosyltransferase family 4 protein [Candidatus Saccharimonas sp.]|nr:glycosyltransferase family 4 protein [Candidatus Saccharimonas sp.]